MSAPHQAAHQAARNAPRECEPTPAPAPTAPAQPRGHTPSDRDPHEKKISDFDFGAVSAAQQRWMRGEATIADVQLCAEYARAVYRDRWERGESVPYDVGLELLAEEEEAKNAIRAE